MQFLAVLHNGCQIDSCAAGRPGLGGLREGLEGVLRADTAEVIETQIEKAPVIHADAVHEDRNLAQAHNRPIFAVVAFVVTVRKLPNNEYPFGPIEVVTADPGYVTAQINSFPR